MQIFKSQAPRPSRSADLRVCRIADVPVGRALEASDARFKSQQQPTWKSAIRQTRRSALRGLAALLPLGLMLAAALSVRAGAITLVPEKVAPAIADRQDFQVPDRVRLSGWVGTRIQASPFIIHELTADLLMLFPILPFSKNS